MKQKRIWSIAILAALLVLSAVAGGVSAYFTDTDHRVHTFTIGKIAIALQEPQWEQSMGDMPMEEEMDQIMPGETIFRDPQVKNTGNADAYVFLTVQMPYGQLCTADADGTNREGEDMALYSYTTNPNWIFLGSSYEKDTQGRYVSVKKLYAYAEESGNCILLKPETATTSLFDCVTMQNITQELEDVVNVITVDAYAIQASNLRAVPGESVKSAQEVWCILSNQKELSESYL